MNRHGLMWKRLTMVIGLALTSLLAVLGLNGRPQVKAQPARDTASMAGASFLYRYNMASQSFITIPLSNGALPTGVAVTGTNPAHVWIAEYGLNRIRQVTFTDTAHYAQAVYSITSAVNSGPYRITVAGNDVWFTERGANRVGRLNALTGHLDEFSGHGLSLNAGLSDIKVAPDGAIWIGGQISQRLIRLTVNSPSDYAFTEYTDTLRPTFSVAPAFLAIDVSGVIWLTAPDATYYRAAQFDASSQDFTWPTLPIGSVPRGVVTTPGYAWLANTSLNEITQIQVGTFTLANRFGPITRPVEIAAAAPNVFWVTQDDGQGAIARLTYTSASFQISSIALPVRGLRPTGIATAPDNSVWVAAYVPTRVYLPLVLSNS